MGGARKSHSARARDRSTYVRAFYNSHMPTPRPQRIHTHGRKRPGRPVHWTWAARRRIWQFDRAVRYWRWWFWLGAFAIAGSVALFDAYLGWRYP